MTARADWPAYVKAMQCRRYDAGLCRACPQPRDSDKLHCAACRRKNAERERNRRP